MLKKKKAMDSKCPGKLDFSAPLLSTRRLGCSTAADTPCSNSLGTAQSTSERIPFSWEQAPGKPKDLERKGDINNEEATPRLRLPPSLWHPPKEATDADSDDTEDVLYDQDDYIDDQDDVFSDAIDVFSLSEAIDIAQKSEERHELDGLKLKLPESSDNHSPNYIIKRFLPDATALAASSSLNIDDKFCYSANPHPEAYVPRQVKQSYAASPKGCGLEILFPWRMKQKLCGIKSPVRQCSTVVQKNQCRENQKKQCSSAHESFTNTK
ncbi:DUF688 family protein [Quillaja saponaria]|uniref:DUF688 family protein n=1 Tax=Quillaja saponaria TaxID=32244 RepID=A0AAD7LNK6_QUISA|nr:DUF688 family protein [Quillaja saponaria]